MSTGGWVLMSVSVGCLLVAVVGYVKSRRRSVTLTETLLANVLHNLSQH